MNINEMTASKIKQTRSNMGIKAAYVAQYLKLSEGSYSKLENGKVKTTLEQLEKIASCFQLPMEKLLNVRHDIVF